MPRYRSLPLPLPLMAMPMRLVPSKELRLHPPPPPPCHAFAYAGNASYMVGEKGRPGDCILSCNRCDLGPNETVRA